MKKFLVVSSLFVAALGLVVLAGPLSYHMPTSGQDIQEIQLEGFITKSSTFKEGGVKKHFECQWDNVTAKIKIFLGVTVTGSTDNDSVTVLEKMGGFTVGSFKFDGQPVCQKVLN